MLLRILRAEQSSLAKIFFDRRNTPDRSSDKIDRPRATCRISSPTSFVSLLEKKDKNEQIICNYYIDTSITKNKIAAIKFLSDAALHTAIETIGETAKTLNRAFHYVTTFCRCQNVKELFVLDLRPTRHRPFDHRLALSVDRVEADGEERFLIPHSAFLIPDYFFLTPNISDIPIESSALSSAATSAVDFIMLHLPIKILCYNNL